MQAEYDFFISYTRADLRWAEWIAWQLEEAGFKTVLQAWDFRPGSNFVLEMQKASQKAQRTVMVLSPDYLKSLYTQPEWTAAFAEDPTGEKGILVPVRVRPCDLEGMLPQIIYIDLVELEEKAAREALFKGIERRRVKPTSAPAFPPTEMRAVGKPPQFPGSQPRGIRIFIAYSSPDKWIDELLANAELWEREKSKQSENGKKIFKTDEELKRMVAEEVERARKSQHEQKTKPPRPGKTEPPKPEEPERVEFSTFAPRTITPNCSFILDVWAYLPHQYSSIISIARELGRDANLGRKTGVPVQKGSILTITIDIENLIVPDPIDTIVWESEPTNASFIIKVPDDAAICKYPGRATISHQGIAIAKIVFLISVETVEGKEYTDHSAETMYPKTAFASYASENREEVLSRIQGMKKVAPDLDIFLDVLSLRSGQNWQEKLEQHVPTKDTFYLFWSVPASRSEWVEREWKLALSHRGLKYIDPVPLEEPDIVPPPQELSALHFSDAYLAYIKYQQIKKNAQNGKES